MNESLNKKDTEKPSTATVESAPSHFIRNIIIEDLKQNKNGGRVFYHVGREDCMTFVTDCYDSGAKKVWVFYSGGPVVAVRVVTFLAETSTIFTSPCGV